MPSQSIDPHDEEAGRKAAQFVDHLNQDDVSLSDSTSTLPKVGLAVGAAAIATMAWLSFSSKSDQEPAITSEGPYTVSSASEDTQYYLDWSYDDRFKDIRRAHIIRAIDALLDKDPANYLANLATAFAPMDVGAFDIKNPEGETIIKFQIVRDVIVRDDDSNKPDRISYTLAYENIPGSPYTLSHSSQQWSEIKISKHGEHVAELHIGRDASNNTYSLRAVNLDGQVISSYDLGTTTPFGTRHYNFIRGRQSELVTSK